MSRGSMVPFVIESNGKGERTYDIYSRLLKDRIIFLSDVITDDVAGSVIAQMLFLQLENEEDDINMYIMSPGGSVNAGLAIYDTMQYVKNDVATHCIGHASSMGAFLLAGGAKGKRFSLPSSRIMIHQPWGSHEGDASSLRIAAKEVGRLKRLLYERLATHTGQTVKKIARDCDRDFFMNPTEAMRYGLIDKIVDRSKAPKPRSRV